MPVVCDYTMINKRLGTTNPKTGKIEEQIFGSWDHPFVIGDAGGGATFGKDRFEVEFRTAAMEHAPALLSLMVRGISTNHPQTDKPRRQGFAGRNPQRIYESRKRNNDRSLAPRSRRNVAAGAISNTDQHPKS